MNNTAPSEKADIREKIEVAILAQTADYITVFVSGAEIEIYIPKMSIWFTQKQKERFAVKEAADILNVIAE